MQVSFAQFVADLETGELFRSGKLRHITRNPFHLLELLLENSGRMVSYAAIGRRLWPDVTVDELHNIKQAAMSLRRALGTEAYLLQCLRGRGYRLMVEVTNLGPSNSTSPIPNSANEADSGVSSPTEKLAVP